VYSHTDHVPRDQHHRLLELLTQLAAAANEADTPVEALQRSLQLIRSYGSWEAAHVVTFAERAGSRHTGHSFWDVVDRECYAHFIEYCAAYVCTPDKGQLLGRCLRERKPVWITDLRLVTPGPRTRLMRDLGVRAAFAFPVTLGSEVVAILEFLSHHVREPDELLLANVDYVVDQLSRPIERERAARITARLAAIVDSSDDAIISRDRDRKIMSWNKAAERLFGYTAEEAVGNGASMLIPPSLEAQAALNQRRLAEGRSVMAYETVRVAKDGRMIDVSVTQSPVKDESGALVAVSIIFRDITEKKKAEIAQSQLAAIVESSNDGIVSLDFEGRIMSWNASAMRMFGYSADQAIGRHVGLLGPDHATAFLRNSGRLRAGEIIAPHEAVCVTRDHGMLDVLVSLSPLVDSTGAIRGASLTFSDISQLKAAQKALSESESRFRAAFEQAAVGMALRAVDPHQPRWLRVNSALCKMLGYTEEELLQVSSLDLTPLEDRALAISYNEQLMTGSVRSYRREKRYLRKDGSTLWTNLSLSVAYGDDGTPMHVISVVEDIQARKMAEQKVERLTRFYTALTRTNEAIVRIKDRQQLFEAVCRIAVSIGGLALAWVGWAEEGTGDVVPVAFDGPGAGYVEGVRRRLRGGLRHARGPAAQAILENCVQVWSDYTERLPVGGDWHADARRFDIASSSVFPLHEEGRVVGCLSMCASEAHFFEHDLVALLGEMAQDLSLALDALALRKREKEANDALVALNAELEQRVAAKTADVERSKLQLEAANEELNAFSYSVSHDMRAPARAIQGFCELILRRNADLLDGDTLRQLQRIESNAVRMGLLVDDLLRLSRIARHDVKRTRLDLAPLAWRCVETLRSEHALDRTAIVVAPSIPVYGDEALLEIALYQLIANALKFSSHASEPRIEVGMESDSVAGPVCYVRDNGTGFDMKYADKLFHAFQRLHKAEDFEGTGIGLSIVQRVVNKHGGRIWAEGRMDAGAVFRFWLPPEAAES
jgi:PAS domain S-box-containing protein